MEFILGFIILCVLLWWVAKNIVKVGRALDAFLSKAFRDRAFSAVRIKRNHEALEKLNGTKRNIGSIKKELEKDYRTKIKQEIDELTKGV